MSRTTEAIMRHIVPPPVGRAILAKKTFVRPNQPNEKKNVLLENCPADKGDRATTAASQTASTPKAGRQEDTKTRIFSEMSGLEVGK
jgi:hypothetical protein